MTNSQSYARLERLEGRQAPRTDSGQHHGLFERVEALKSRLEARADHNQAERLRADVREARGHVRSWNPDRVSQNTATRYGRAVEAMRQAGIRPEEANTSATYEFRRAALVHVTRQETKQALTALDRARRAGDVERAAEAYNQVRIGLETLRRYPPSTGSREADLQRQSLYAGPPGRAGHSKRDSLSSLPEGWRDDVQRQVPPEDRAALAAMSLTGCRPAEVKGIRVHQAADKVLLEIRGAKVDQARGVEHREIVLAKASLTETQAGRDLAEWLGNRSQRTIAHAGTADAFAERIGRACERAGHSQASAYSFRHQAARDLRQSGASREDIAARLGHRSERSQSVYG